MRVLGKILKSSILAVIVTLSSCSSNPIVNQDNSDILVSVGDSSLTVNDVLMRMPSGLAPADSIDLFNRIVEEWIRDLVLPQYAEDNIADIDKIDRMVEAYRKNLIVNQYLQLMSESSKKDITDQRIKDFYNNNHQSLILEQPLVKGIFLKVNENDESLADLREWLKRFDNNAIDEIEKNEAKKAKQYKYFNDEWVEWSVIADLIPVRYQNADEFLKSNEIFEHTEKGYTYLLRVSDFIPSGSEMPLDFAKFKIAEILQSSDMISFRQKLLSDIYKTQIQKGKLVPGLFDPLTGEIKHNNN